MHEVKSTGTAIVLSFFWTGLGQLYAGEIGRGIVVMILTPIVWTIGWVGGFTGLLGGIVAAGGGGASAGGVGLAGVLMAILPFVWWVWGMVDAKQLCDRWNSRPTILH